MFRKKKEVHEPAMASSPRAMIRPPGSIDDGNLTMAAPLSPIKVNRKFEPEPSHSSPTLKVGAKVLLKPNIDTTTDAHQARTQQELVVGKGLIRPMPSPVAGPRDDFFSRFSFKRPQQPIVATTAAESPARSPAQSLETEEPVSATVRNLENASEDEVIARIAERRGWGKTLPTTNPHCMHVLLKESNPFKRIRHLETAGADDICASLESTVYCSPKAIGSASKHKFRRGDVVVAGCTRSGQTPILQILASLKAKEYQNANQLLESVTWLEGPFKPPATKSGRQIIKTHIPLPLAMKGEHAKLVEHKIIVVIRDPADVRLSWFRHVRRLFKKCTQKSIDQRLDVTSFANVSLPMPLLTKQQENDVLGKEPETWVFWALKYQQEFPECVLAIFYEELLTDPCRVVEKIAQFTRGMGEEREPRRAASSGIESVDDEKRDADARRKEEAELVVSIAKGLMADSAHPNASKRNGSSGQASLCFNREALENFDQYWEKIVGASRLGKFTSYQHLYQSVLKHKYPFSSEMHPTGSGGLLARMSNLTASSESQRPGRADSMPSTSTAGSNVRLKKKTSSAESESVVKPRRFGGSFISFIGGSSKPHKELHSTGSGPSLTERPTVSNLPHVYPCVDPDDSDEEVSKCIEE